jgi:3D (Asp-Asp-Asp) domain-containing protein
LRKFGPAAGKTDWQKSMKNFLSLISAWRRNISFSRTLLLLLLLAAVGIGGAAASRGGELSPTSSPLQVHIFVDGQWQTLTTSETTVAGALREAGLVLGEFDRVRPALEERLWQGRNIRVIRIETSEITETTVDPAKTVVLADPDLRTGLSLKIREGRDGKIAQQVRIWKRDGEESGREVVKRTVLRAKTDAVELRGEAGLTSRHGSIRGCLLMEATAYDPGPRSCGKYADGYTANGMKAEKGVVAIDPRVIPMGTRLYVEGYGLAIAADTGGAIKGHRIDLCFPTYTEALRYGRRTVKVYLLD